MMLFSITLLLSSLTASSWAALQVPITVARSKSTTGLSRRAVNAPLTNLDQGSRYLLNGSLGTPPQGPISWFIDTGSSPMISFAYNSTTCVAPYDPNAPEGCLYGTFNPSESSTYVITGAGQLNSQYGYNGGYGFNPGDLFTDTVTIAGTAITDVAQGITYGQNSSYVENDPFSNGLGIMGLAGGPNGNYPSILGRLLAQGTINRAAFSVWENARNAADGEIVFGGVDHSKYTGSLIATSFSGDTNYPLSAAMTGFSLVDAAGASHSLFPAGFGGSSMLIDTGNSDFFALPPNVLSLFLTALGASNETSTLVVPCDLSASTASLNFAFGGAGGPVINVPVSALVADENPNADPFFNTDGSSIPACNLTGISAMDSTNSGNLGTLWQEWAYMVFDEQDGLIALAQSAQNTAAESIEDFTNVNSIPGAVATVTYTIANPGATRTDVSVLTTATSTVKNSVTGYPCVTPEYNLGVSVCQASTTSNTPSSTTSSSTSSTSSSTKSSSNTSTTSSSTSSTSTKSTSSSSSSTLSTSRTSSSKSSSSSTNAYSSGTWSTSWTTRTSGSSTSSSGTWPIASSTSSSSSSTSSSKAGSSSNSARSTDGSNHGGWPVDPTSVSSSSSASTTSSSSGSWPVDPKSTSSSSTSSSLSATTSWSPWSADPSSSSTSSSSWPVDPASTSSSPSSSTIWSARSADPTSSSSSSAKKTSSSTTSMTWGAWSADPSKVSPSTSTSSSSSMIWSVWSADPSKTSASSTSASSSTIWGPWSSSNPSSAASSTLSASTRSSASSKSSSATSSSSAATPYNPASASSFSSIAGWGSSAGPTTTKAASSSPVAPLAYGSASGVAPFKGAASKPYSSAAMMLGAAALVAAAVLI